ncbi:MAG: CDP-diacylglycerol--serine O-phosphatidyltransferase [Candidatus Nanohalarchaeota archaeon]|nr:MAG: CDP-diacylglycerol--serine O-phosphatidyltransferase [Candidatus Nanohaloarchaeota archaeon]
MKCKSPGDGIMSLVKWYFVTGLTLLNAMCGSLAILFAFSGDYRYSSLMLVIAVLADQLDGQFARMLGQTSDIGKELDSLSDAISFGVAPMILIYNIYLETLGSWGIAIGLVLVSCSVYRLAKFNVIDISEHFLGIPTPVIAGFVIGLVVGNVSVPPIYIGLMTIALSFLMVSNVKYYNFKKYKSLKNGERVIISIEAVVVVLGLFFYPDNLFIVGIAAYVVFAPIVRFLLRE